MAQNVVTLSFDKRHFQGVFSRGNLVPDGVWIRLRTEIDQIDREARYGRDHVALNWSAALTVLRVLSALQGKLGFAFATDESSTTRVHEFMAEYSAVRRAAEAKVTFTSNLDLEELLADVGWDHTKRKLKNYQLDNLRRLIAIPHGANFSVPGAGKTTVTWALHLLLQKQLDCLLVVAPKNAFPAWNTIIDECMSEHSTGSLRQPFTMLIGGEHQIDAALTTKTNRFIISYDQLIRVDRLIERLVATRATHLILDESHRMKEGYQSKRGAALLGISHLAKRRDILSGTPMPQSPFDMLSQLDFLWPGVGLGTRISRGEAPRTVLGNLYVRTTKRDLGLPERKIKFVDVQMHPAHRALYSVIRDDLRAQASVMHSGRAAFDLIKARRSVMRLLQASSVPETLMLAMKDVEGNVPALMKAVAEEGPSTRIVEAARMARNFARAGRKVVIWTIFTYAVEKLRFMLGDLNPAVIYGAVGTGSDSDPTTREGNLKKFKDDSSCWVMIANPAAAAESINLHMHCHDAIYVDRSYNATHFLQSIDRIHRLGLPKDVLTYIYILRNEVPPGLGSIDFSVGRRLATKIRNMEKLLNDHDLHELALDEENAEAPIDDSISVQDIDDLIEEIEGRSTGNTENLM
jgi:hypothetical protein